MAARAHYYAKFPGVPGLVQEPKFIGWVELDYLSAVVIPDGSPNWGEFDLTLKMGRAATQLAMLAATGQKLDGVRIVYVPPADAKAPRMVSELKLDDVIVAASQFGAAKCQIRINYGKIGRVHWPAPDGR